MAYFFRCPLCNRLTTWADDESPSDDPSYAHEASCFVLRKGGEQDDERDPAYD